MRGQVEKLQSDENHLKQGVAILDDVAKMLEGGTAQSQRLGSPSTITETLEMLIQAQEAERQRLSRQMHDGPAQALSNFILQTEIAVRLFDLDQAKAREELTTLMKTATAAFQKIRDFIFDLRPMMLDDLGLIPTLKRYVEAIKEKSSVDIQLVVTGTERRFESYLEVMIFRAIQELVGNALRHSQANMIMVKIDISDTNIQVGVEDNGKGIDMESFEDEGGMGLKVIRDRVEMLGGYFNLESLIEDGTRVVFQVPAGKTAVIG
jgi:two-component system sensor histidine kinase DegS